MDFIDIISLTVKLGRQGGDMLQFRVIAHMSPSLFKKKGEDYSDAFDMDTAVEARKIVLFDYPKAEHITLFQLTGKGEESASYSPECTRSWTWTKAAGWLRAELGKATSIEETPDTVSNLDLEKRLAGTT